MMNTEKVKLKVKLKSELNRRGLFFAAVTEVREGCRWVGTSKFSVTFSSYYFF